MTILAIAGIALFAIAVVTLAAALALRLRRVAGDVRREGVRAVLLDWALAQGAARDDEAAPRARRARALRLRREQRL